ncbi:MAG: polysaccharide biosynthesis protein, partial [Thermomonas sp.]
MSTWKERFKYGLPRLAVILHDLVMVWMCWQGLHYIRYALQPQPLPLEPFSSTVLIVVVAQGLVSWWVGLYRGLWRFASVPDLINIFKASLLGLLAIVVGLFFHSRLDLIS